MFHHGDAIVGIAGQSYELAGETTFSDVEHYNEFVSRLSNTMALVSDFPFEIVPVGMREDTYCVASEFSSDNGWLSDSKEVRYPVYRYEFVDTWRWARNFTLVGFCSRREFVDYCSKLTGPAPKYTLSDNHPAHYSEFILNSYLPLW